MARIPEDEIERLKKEIAVERLAEAKGVKLRRHGQDLLGLCPFHEDREPSLVISPAKNLWHCLGACQTGGSPIDWVMRAEGVSFRHAVEFLRGDVSSSPATTTAGIVKQSTVKKLPALLERDADDDALMLRVVDYYHRALKESPEALAYLASRGLRDGEIVDRFRLGFANRTLGYRLPEKNRKEGAEIRGRLQKLGVMRESGHEHFNGSIVVPIFDESGRVTEMYGRKITPGLRPGTPQHLYLPGPHRGVWNIEAMASSREMIVCESLIDAMTFWCAGFRNVTSSYGVEGFTEDHWKAIRKHGTRVVRIAYDRDEAGERAAARLGEELVKAGLEVYRVEFPKGMDANAYAEKVQPATKSLGLVLRHASWMGGTPKIAAVDGEPEPTRAVVVSETPPAPPEPAPIISLAASEESEAREASPASAAASATSSSSSPSGDEVVLRFGDRRWRVRGLGKNLSYEQMRVNLLVGREDGAVFIDTLELYSARQRSAFVKQASEELGLEERVIKRELGEILVKLEELQDAQIKSVLSPKEPVMTMTEEERESALSLLRHPQLLDRILADFERCGVVGEETNKLVGYLAAVSRKLEEPLAVVIQSSSAAGKSRLMEAVLALMPEEERVQYSAMTGQSLFYMGEQDLKQKILAIVEEEGAQRASYALKLLQSEGALTIASTGKDPVTGKLVTHAYRVEGPVMIFLTTTAIEVDEELLNRCLVLTVDEGAAQTRAIHALQRESQTLEGLLLRHERTKVRAVHKNAQRLLRPLLVANPYARELTFSDARTRTRRDHMKYLTLIRTIALLHQYQREVKTVERGGELVRYIEATKDDIAVADRLSLAVLGRSLDELPPQTRRLLGLVEELVRARGAAEGVEATDVRFTRREVREQTGWGHTQMKIHMQRLEELEYVLAHRGMRGQSFVYELAYGSDGAPVAVRGYDAKWSGIGGKKSGGGRGQVGGMSGPRPTTKTTLKSGENGPSGEGGRGDRDHAYAVTPLNGTSYVHASGERSG
jgi:DNA primase catalytic core